MPARQNQDLHDMHALLQQLDTLNSMHAPDHLEGWPSMPKMPDLGITKRINGAIAARKDQKERDADVMAEWRKMKEDTTKRTTLKKVVDTINPDVLAPVLLGNAATKQQTQECILPLPSPT
jgi:hypothetical protein